MTTEPARIFPATIFSTGNLIDEFIKDTYGYIKDNYGSEYVGYVKKSNKTENVQDAHEAIRPTNINLSLIHI